MLQRPVVGRAERRLAVRLVHAEHERAGDAVGVHDPLEFLVLPAPAVDVVPEMEMRVEDLGAVGQQAPKLLVVAREQLLGARKRLVHEKSVYVWSSGCQP